MASVIINGIQYNDVPEVNIPKVGGGTAKFIDNSTANVTASDIRNGKKAGTNSGIVTGTMSERVAMSYLPSVNDQTINANQYLAGVQTFRGVTLSNLSAQYILSGVTVKVGCSADDDCVASVTGTMSVPTVSQDSTTKVLTIQ